MLWYDNNGDPSTWWKYHGLLDNQVLPRWGEAPNKIAKEDIEVWVASLPKSKDDGGSFYEVNGVQHAGPQNGKARTVPIPEFSAPNSTLSSRTVAIKNYSSKPIAANHFAPTTGTPPSSTPQSPPQA